MIKIAYLCAVMVGAIPCTPFNSLDGCKTARGELVAALVERSECAQVEIHLPSSIYAPEKAPIPKERP